MELENTYTENYTPINHINDINDDINSNIINIDENINDINQNIPDDTPDDYNPYNSSSCENYTPNSDDVFLILYNHRQ